MDLAAAAGGGGGLSTKIVMDGPRSRVLDWEHHRVQLRLKNSAQTVNTKAAFF